MHARVRGCWGVGVLGACVYVFLFGCTIVCVLGGWGVVFVFLFVCGLCACVSTTSIDGSRVSKAC